MQAPQRMQFSERRKSSLAEDVAAAVVDQHDVQFAARQRAVEVRRCRS